MNGYTLDSAPRELQSYIHRLVKDIVTSFPGRIVSVILHGSLAMGSFYPPKSDIDLLIVSRLLDESERREFFSLLRDYHERRPYIGGLEVSVLLESDAGNPGHPLPFLVHFSETTFEVQKLDGDNLPKDGDLTAHLMVAKIRGKALYGLPPHAVIGPIEWSDYLCSVKDDINWILEDENILTSPFYSVLNLCRWVMIMRSKDAIVPSKEEAGLWALEHFPPDHRAIIREALEAYRSNTPVKDAPERRMAGRTWDRDALLRFRDVVSKDPFNPVP